LQRVATVFGRPSSKRTRLQIEETHELINPHTAVELSFMASGLGPWRPDMNT
jgi:hypothetical protein